MGERGCLSGERRPLRKRREALRGFGDTFSPKRLKLRVIKDPFLRNVLC